MEPLLSLQIFAGMLVLVAASGLFIHSLVHVGRMLKIREDLIIFVLVGFATALPELFIGLNAIITNTQDIAVGNAIGTSIAALSFVAGMVAVFSRKFKTDSFFEHHDLTTLSVATVFLFILASDGALSRLDGAILLVVFIYYLWNVIDQKHKLTVKVAESRHNLFVHIVVLLITGVSIFLASQYVVFSAYFLEQLTFLPGVLIALVLIAPMGIVPELIIEFELIRNRSHKLSFGDLFTSVIINTTLVVGLVAFIKPFGIGNQMLLSFSGVFLLLVILLFNLFAKSRKEIDWKEGLILVLAYFMFIINCFLINRI